MDLNAVFPAMYKRQIALAQKDNAAVIYWNHFAPVQCFDYLKAEDAAAFHGDMKKIRASFLFHPFEVCKGGCIKVNGGRLFPLEIEWGELTCVEYSFVVQWDVSLRDGRYTPYLFYSEKTRDEAHRYITTGSAKCRRHCKCCGVKIGKEN